MLGTEFLDALLNVGTLLRGFLVRPRQNDINTAMRIDNALLLVADCLQPLQGIPLNHAFSDVGQEEDHIRPVHRLLA